MSIFRQFKSFKNAPFPPFQLISLNKFWARSKKIEPKAVPGKYDVNQPRSFTYSYENISDNLEKSGRKTYIYRHSSQYRRSRLKIEYLDFKQQERRTAEALSKKDIEITEERAKKIVQFLDQYEKENPLPEKTKSKQLEFDIQEMLKAEIKPPEPTPHPTTEKYKIKEEVSLAIEDNDEGVEDAVWGKEKPLERKYDRIKPKELFWISRNERHYNDSDRRLNYLKEFVRPYVIHDAELQASIQKIKEKTPEKCFNEANPDFQIEKVYLENKETAEIFNTLKVQIMKTHYKQLPNIALSLTYDLRYKADVFKIWSYIEKEIFQNLHHFSLLEVAKIRYALAGIMPKIGSPALHKACVDLIKQEIKQANVYDILYIYTSYKMSAKKVHAFLYNELLNRKEEVCALAKQDPDLIANIIYTYANSRIEKRNRKVMRSTNEHIKEAEKFVDNFYDELMAGFDKVSLESAARLSIAFTILRLENYLDILLKIQKKALDNLDKMDAFLVSSFLYSFSKFSKGRAEGELKFYNKMTNLVEKFWPEFTNKEKARIFYAYTSRGFTQQTCGLIDKYFIPWAKENVSVLAYSEMSNTIMSLMFLRFVDKEFWKALIKNVAHQKYVVPLSHYYNFQMCKYYLSIYYPKWNLKALDQALCEAGSIFNTERVPRPTEDEEFLEFYRLMQFKFHINNKPFLEWENLFTIDIAILPQKVGIFKQGIVENFQDSYDIRPIYNLKKFILDNKGWKIWVLNWKEYMDQGANKDNWAKQHFMEVYTEQTVRFSRKKEDEEKNINYFEKYYDNYHYWAPKLGLKPVNRMKEVKEDGTVEYTLERKKTVMDARAFAVFGKQGVVKTPAAGAPGGGTKPAAAAPTQAAPKKPPAK